VGAIETLFLSPSDDQLVTSSTYVKDLWNFGGQRLKLLMDLVPANVIEAFAELRDGNPALKK